METNKAALTPIETIIEETEKYINTRGELLAYKTLYKASDAISEAISAAITLVLFIPFFALLNVGICIWLGNVIHSVSAPFFIMAGFYLLLGLILLSIRKSRVKPAINNHIIKQALK